jgi:hypothetical protein
MLDAPPPVPIDLSETAQAQVETHLPMEERPDGSLVIDLTPLENKDRVEQCVQTDPNPLENGILVCRVLTTDQRLSESRDVSSDDLTFGSAVPRARFRLSKDTAGEINGTAPSVGGWNAQGTEVRIRIGF